LSAWESVALTKIASVDTVSMPDQFDAMARTPGEPEGAEFTALLAQVVGESSFKPHAENKRTGAAGPFQFVKNTWLAMVRSHGEEFGIKPELVRQITLDAKGRAKVADPSALKDVLDLRHDVALSSRMAVKYRDDSRAHLTRMLHRPPSDAEVHLAFLLGPTGATHLIHAAAVTPNRASSEVVAPAVAANPSLFHDKSGRVRSAAEAVAFLTEKYRSDMAKVGIYAQAKPVPPKGTIDA
jgi:hypothetical protein